MTDTATYPGCEKICAGCTLHRDLSCPKMIEYQARVREYMASWKLIVQMQSRQEKRREREK